MGVVRIAFVEVFKIGDAVVARIAAERTNLQVPEIVRAYEGAKNSFPTISVLIAMAFINLSHHLRAGAYDRLRSAERN